MNPATLLALLPKIGPVIAALPEFKRLFNEVVAAFDTLDQAELRAAYELALSNAADAHDKLQALVRQARG